MIQAQALHHGRRAKLQDSPSWCSLLAGMGFGDWPHRNINFLYCCQQAACMVQEKPQWFKRKPSIVKVHMLLLAHLARRPVPAPLQKDLEFVLKKAPLLLEEVSCVNIAMLDVML